MVAHRTQDSLPPRARVLIVRLSALGDVIFALETLASLKAERPDVRVDFMVEDRFAAVLRGHPSIERVLEMPRKRWSRIPQHIRQLRSVRYDVVLDLHGILKSGLHVWLTSARRKLGFASPGSREGAGLFYNERVRLPKPLPHRAARGHYLLQALGLRAPPEPTVLPPGEELASIFPDAATTRVILHPGTSSFAAFKRWPTHKFIALAAQLCAEGMSVAVSYGPGERDLFEQIHAAVPAVLEIPGPDLGLIGLAQAMRQADLVVAADTGPLHIAAGVGTRVVALFGPKDSNLYGPRGEGHRVLFHPVPCRPCRRRTCASPQCILGITVDDVTDAVRELRSS